MRFYQVRRILSVFVISLAFLHLSPHLSFAKTFLVTCATSGLGQSIAEMLAEEKHSLVLAARNQSSLSEIASHIQKRYSTEVITTELNFESLEKVQQASTQLLQRIKERKLDGIVLIGPRPSFSTKEIPDGLEWQKNFQEAFIGPLQLIRNLAGTLKKPSSIVVISGVTSKYYIPAYPNTNVIRMMWSAEIKNLVNQLASSGTRVNAVSPGVILTQHNQNLLESRAKQASLPVDQQLEKETATIPLHRHGTPDEVASTVKFLLSDQAAFLNGENIALDGGLNPSY